MSFQTKLPPSEQQIAFELLEEFLPIAMRFLGDPYDDTSSQVFHVFTDILSTVRFKDAPTVPNLIPVSSSSTRKPSRHLHKPI